MAPAREQAAGGLTRWFGWLLGIALLGAVIYVALHFSEEKQLLDLVRKARPLWLIVAVTLQALTYVAQGESYRVVAHGGGQRLPSRVAWRLSLSKLFFDQAVPSLGLSGTVVAAGALEQRGLKRPVVAAAMIVDMIGAHLAYVVGLLAALTIALATATANPWWLIGALVFLAYCVGFAALVLGFAGRGRLPRWLARIPIVGSALALVPQADPRLARRPSLIAKSSLFELSVVLLDAATVWVLIRSLGYESSVWRVFAAFMLSTLLRTVSITPSGIGAFEAASTVTLKLAGVPLPAALAATLMFHGLSFWLPMLPGVVIAWHERRNRERGRETETQPAQKGAESA